MEDELYLELARQLLDSYPHKGVDVEELAEYLQERAEAWLREFEERRMQ